MRGVAATVDVSFVGPPTGGMPLSWYWSCTVFPRSREALPVGLVAWEPPFRSMVTTIGTPACQSALGKVSGNMYWRKGGSRHETKLRARRKDLGSLVAQQVNLLVPFPCLLRLWLWSFKLSALLTSSVTP